MIPSKLYLIESVLPNGKIEASKLKAKAYDYCIYEGKLYRKGKWGLDLKCLIEIEYKKVLKELHEGACRLHSEGRSLAHRAMTQGYFWPYMIRVVAEYVKKYDKCQNYANIIRQPLEDLRSIINPWSFM